MKTIIGCFIAFFFSYAIVGKAQVEKRKPYEINKINFPFGSDTFTMSYMRVFSPEGLTFLSTKMLDTSRYPLYIFQRNDAEPFNGVLKVHLEKTDTLGKLNQILSDRIKVLEEKEKVWITIQTMQEDRVTFMQKYNKDLRDINDTLSGQYKAAISTAKQANKGGLWQAVKDIGLGAAIGALIVLIFK
jgi:hypothetical protein